MRKKTIGIILLTLFNYNPVSGQNSGNQNQYDASIKNVPTSPEIALLGRFGDIPVGYYTGTAEVSIPLYTLKVDHIEIPLLLTYHTSGIKVSDEATWVGLGWNFLPEGTITQEIRGREDSVTGSDGFNTTQGYDNFKSLFPTLNSENQLYRLQVGFKDYNDGQSGIGNNANPDDGIDIINRLKEKYGQPDIFTYNFYGYSGKFFYNPENSNEILFLESNDDVKFTRSSEGWLATTNKGDKFYFYTIEKSKSNQTDYTDIGYTFKISKIQLTTGKMVTFSYMDESTYQEYPTQVAHITNFTASPNIITNYNSTINNKKTLTEIETEDTKIVFNLNNREDIRPYTASTPIKKLSSIDIKSKYPDKKIKSFIFNQSYFPFNAVSNAEEGYKNKRLKLNSVQEVNFNESGNIVQSTPPYQFEYNLSSTMPSKMFSSDFFGYYNGVNSIDLLPDLAFFDYLNKPPYKNYGLNVNYNYNTVNRYPNSDYVSINLLKKILYPTGARTEFEYETNTFSNQFIPTSQQVLAATKDESITHRGASTVPGGYYFLKSQPFKISATRKIKFDNTIFDGYMGPNYPETHYDYYQMLNCNIQLIKRKIISGQYSETVLKEWKVDVAGSVFEQTHQQVWNDEVEVVYDNDPTTEYYVYVSNGIIYNNNDGMHRALVSSRFRFFDDGLIDKSVSFGNGVRIKSIKNYENNTLLSQKLYEYNGGKLMYPFQPLNLIKEATYKGMGTVQSGGCYQESLAIFNDLSVNSSDFGISGIKAFGYDKVFEKDINVQDGTTKGVTQYTFINNAPTGTVLKGIPKVDIPTNGENTLIETYDKNQIRLSSRINSYEALPNTYGIYPSFSIINTSTGPYDPRHQAYPIKLAGCNGGDIIVGNSYTGHTFSNAAATTKYNFIFSPLITGKRRLKTTINTSYLGDKTLIEKTEMTYTDSGNLDTSLTTTSDGKVIYTDYDYAYDLNNSRLINKGMTGIPLSKEIQLNGKMISNLETKYDSPAHYLPTSIQSSDLYNSTMNTEVIYNKYDIKGNLLQYTTKEGIPISLVWGYNNTQVIAKIIGIDYDSVASLSGFSDIISKSNGDVDENTENIFIDTLDLFRKNNANYQMTTYTYDPLIGVRSITPPSGIREYYRYDSANRLEKVIDSDKKVLKEFKYNYKN